MHHFPHGFRKFMHDSEDLDFAFFGKVVGGQCVVGKISDVVYITVAGMLPATI